MKSNTGESYAVYDSNMDLFGRFSTREEAAQRAVSLGLEPVNEVAPTQLRAMNRVPDAPFKSSWHELTLKRMLRYAAENGYDKLAFIDGEKTADRYDLSKKISQVMYNETSESLMAYDRLGNNVLLERGVPPEKIADYIGKEPAERLLSQPLDEIPGEENVKIRRMKGEELQVGGEWAFNLYDRMIPQFLKKYGKKFGAKVEDVAISIPDFVEPENFKAIDITPQMRGEEGCLLYTSDAADE